MHEAVQLSTHRHLKQIILAYNIKFGDDHTLSSEQGLIKNEIVWMHKKVIFFLSKSQLLAKIPTYQVNK